MTEKPLCRLLRTDYPIIQAPMAGASTPEMAAAASNAGAMGSLGCAMLSADGLKDLIETMGSLTNRSVNYNFFCHTDPVDDEAKARSSRETLAGYYTEFDLGEVPAAKPTHYPFDDEMCAVLTKNGARIASFHFGLPPQRIVKQLKDAGLVILSSATTVAEARFLEASGADAIIAQGFEAGGHRGFFLEGEDACMGTMALVPQVVDAVSVPVIAAGGIADARGIRAAFELGASGVQIGTAFLNCVEAGIPEVHKRELMKSDGSNTRTTKVFSGRPARGVINRYMEELREKENNLPDFPIMNTLTGPLRKASAANQKPDFVSLWSGQAVGLNKETTTSELIQELVHDAGLQTS